MLGMLDYLQFHNDGVSQMILVAGMLERRWWVFFLRT